MKKKGMPQMTEADYRAFIDLEQRALKGVVGQRLGTEAEFFSLLRVAVRQRDILFALGEQAEADHHAVTALHSA